MAFRQLTEARKYSFINARLKARKSQLLSALDYEYLLTSTIAEGLTFLDSNPRYHELFTALNLSSANFLIELEKALYSSAYNEFFSLSKYIPKETYDFIEFFLKKPFIKELKAILRAVHEQNIDKISLEEIFVATSEEKQELVNASKAKSIESLIASLETSWIHNALKSSLSEYYKQNNSLILENALDYYFYKRIWNIEIPKLKGTDQDISKKVIGIEIDLFNICVILRCKILSIPIDEILINMIPIQFQLDTFGIRAAKAVSFSEAIDLLEVSSYSDLIQSINRGYQEKNSISDLDLLKQQYFIQSLFSLMTGNPFHIGTFLLYLILRLQEVENLRIIFVAKSSEIDLKKAREFLIYFK